MLHDLNLSLQSASDSRAVVEISGPVIGAKRDDNIRLNGPICVYARTLPTTYVAAARSGKANGAEILIPDPCYWTPELPFLYELATGPGERRQVGLRRLAFRGASLYWEGKRIVIRGCRVGAVSDASIADVRGAEVAMLVPHPTEEHCKTADEHGMPLIADLRDAAGSGAELCGLSSHPSVAIILLDERQRTLHDEMRPALCPLVAAAIELANVHSAPPWCDVIAVELEPGQRPPSWLAQCGKPVIAIRRGETYADLHEARAACDRLQAELAPEFDLAGYFV